MYDFARFLCMLFFCEVNCVLAKNPYDVHKALVPGPIFSDLYQAVHAFFVPRLILARGLLDLFKALVGIRLARDRHALWRLHAVLPTASFIFVDQGSARGLPLLGIVRMQYFLCYDALSTIKR